MRKFIIIIFIFFMFIPKVDADELLENARSGILIEASTGEILYEKNKDERVSVASLTKMMVQTIVLEKIEDGSIKWDDVVVASSNASGMGGTQIWLSTGEKMTVSDLFKGMSVVSANDATVALCEYIAGSESNCVALMNEKAKELGLKNTVFKNCTGLDEKGHFSSAYDLSIIARNLLKHDEILDYSSIYEDYIRKDTPNKYWIVNTNKLLRFYEGTDGLKTGFTDDALYTIAATSKRNNMRLIAIVLGEKESKVRNSETMELLDYGFLNYKVEILKKRGEIVDYLNIDKADEENVPIILESDLSILNKKSVNSINYRYDIKLNDVSLPIKKNGKVGVISLVDNGKIIKSVDLISASDIYKINYFRYLLNNILGIL